LDNFDLICGVPYAALPMATAMSLESYIPLIIKRKEAKSYGTKKLIEGIYQKGQNCLLVEDVITSGKSLLETIPEIEQEDLKVSDIVVVLDREQGGKQLWKAKDTEYTRFLIFLKYATFFRKLVNYLMKK
jgi:uridine monophosphate synthetase